MHQWKNCAKEIAISALAGSPGDRLKNDSCGIRISIVAHFYFTNYDTS
jgi:hypothetical protein